MPGKSSRSVKITRLLIAWSEGRKDALDDLLPLVYEELRRVATSYVRRERPGQALQPTALVHEVYLRLDGGRELSFEHSAQFFAYAARAMRHVLVDRARGRMRQKAGGDWIKVTFTANADAQPAIQSAEQALALEEALTKLEQTDERAARVVELRDLRVDDSVGYDATWRATRPSRVATLALGYADGYRRSLGNNAEALVNGRRVPVIGTVMMDMTVIDVTGVPCAVGDRATLFGADGDDRLLLVNLGRDLHLDPSPEPLLAPPENKVWDTLWSSEHPRYGGIGTSRLDSEENWRLPGHAAVALVPKAIP